MASTKVKIVNVVKLNKRLYSYLLYTNYLLRNRYIKKKRKGNIMMLHPGRAGSSVLADLLSQHSQIQWDGEIFIESEKYLKFLFSAPLKFLEYKMYQHNYPYYGFEIKGMAYQDIDRHIRLKPDLFFKSISQKGFDHFIFLKRNNYLRRHISFMQYRAGGKLHTTSEIKKIKKIIIGPVFIHRNHKFNLVEYFRILNKNYQNLSVTLSNYNTLTITYEEDILPDPLIAYQKISDFLGIKNENPTIHLKRTNPFNIKELVENYEEINLLLKDTEFAWMLKDENY